MKSKYDTTPAKLKERSNYPQGYYPNGEWAGFFAGEDPEKLVIEWCKKEKGRTFNWVPLPKPEPRVESEEPKKRTIKKFTPKVPVPAPKNGSGRRKPTSKPKPKKQENIEWEAEDIRDEEKMAKVAKKSQDEAIQKLKSKK